METSAPTSAEADLPFSSPDTEGTTVHVISNLPADTQEAEPFGALVEREWTDEDDDEDLDMSELEDDLAELEEELDQGGWDDAHGAFLACSTLPLNIG